MINGLGTGLGPGLLGTGTGGRADAVLVGGRGTGCGGVLPACGAGRGRVAACVIRLAAAIRASRTGGGDTGLPGAAAREVGFAGG